MTGHYPSRGRRGAWLLAPVTFLLTVAVLFLLGIAGPAALDALVPRIEDVFTPRHARTQPIDVEDGEAAVEEGPSSVTGGDDPCGLIVGSAGDYCDGTPPTEPDLATTFLFIGPAVLGIGVLSAVRRRR